MSNTLRVKRFCLKCIALRVRRNHPHSICPDCVETVAQFLSDAYDYSPVNDAEALLGGDNE